MNRKGQPWVAVAKKTNILSRMYMLGGRHFLQRFGAGTAPNRPRCAANGRVGQGVGRADGEEINAYKMDIYMLAQDVHNE